MAAQRILIVDDNEDFCRTFAMVIEQPAREVRYATDGLQALDLVRAWAPQVIFLDLGMRGLDGYEMAHRLRKALPDVRIYAVTGYDSAAERARTRAAGFDGHFSKTVDASMLEKLL